MNIIFENYVTESGKPLGGYDLLMDMGKYEDVVSYAKAVIKFLKKNAYTEAIHNNDVPELIPTNFCIMYRGSGILIVDEGCLLPYVQKNLDKLSRNVDEQVIAFTSPTMQVHYNVLKNSLFIIL